MVYRPRERVWTAAAFSTPTLYSAAVTEHLRLTDETEETLVAGITSAAILYVEKHTQRLLLPRTITLRLPGLPSEREAVELPGGVVTGTPVVTADGSPVTGFQVVGDSPALLVPNANWPAVTGEVYPVTITYTAGFQQIPYDLLQAVCLLAGEMFERRTNGETVMIQRVPVSAEFLMAPHRIRPI